jgi:hypothetical protein
MTFPLQTLPSYRDPSFLAYNRPLDLELSQREEIEEEEKMGMMTS